MHYSACLPRVGRLVPFALVVVLSACLSEMPGGAEGALPTPSEGQDVGEPLELIGAEPRAERSASCLDGSCTSLLPDSNSTILQASKNRPGAGGGCGDGRCHKKESCSTCEADCGVCPSEDPPADDPPADDPPADDPPADDPPADDPPADDPPADDPPSAPEPVCGDDVCDDDETCESCANDCGSCPVEPPPADDPPPPPQPFCGDDVCDDDETCDGCANDCGACPVEPPPPDDPPPATEPVCGDGQCNGNSGEMCTVCANDCLTLEPVCGNGACETGESSSSCFGDCGHATWPSDWATWEAEVVTLINQARAAGTDCPSGAKSPVGPLTLDNQLRTASRLHSWDQSYSGYFAHASCNGRSPWARASAQGTSADGETIGWGYSSPSAMVNGWLTSTTGHCDILMSGGNSVVGVGFASPGARLWTAMFR